MQRLKLNSRIITIFGIFSSVVGLILMADWQSIPHDPCTDFSLYHHPEIAKNLSNRLNPCLTALSGCHRPQNGGSVHNMSTAENKVAVIELFVQYVEMPESIVRTQGERPVFNVTTYNRAMNVCESLRESQYHCHWVPKSVLTGELCEACPAMCRGIEHTLNFIQFAVGALIYRISYPIPWVANMIVLSDVVSKDYQVGYR